MEQHHVHGILVLFAKEEHFNLFFSDLFFELVGLCNQERDLRFM